MGSLASDAELVLKTEIGDGGNGVIFAASQRSLGREVAVKRPVPEAKGDEARATLVQEARVTGSLEHPNGPRRATQHRWSATCRGILRRRARRAGRLPGDIPHRKPPVLCDLQGHSCEEAARQLGCPVGSRLSRARQRLRENLSRGGMA